MRTFTIARLSTLTVTLLAAATVAALTTAVPAGAATRPASAHSVIVLGQKGFMGPNGRGWGVAHPEVIDNGGDPSGIVSDITWHNWGQQYAQGWGKTSIFKPGGGFYPHLVRAELRAAGRGHCTAGGPRSYKLLYARVPSKPGGRLGHWFRWSGAASICGRHS